MHGISAQNLRLGECNARVAHRVHAGFELLDVFFQTDVRRRNVKAPLVNAACNVLKAAADVCGQLSKRRFQLLRERIATAVFD